MPLGAFRLNTLANPGAATGGGGGTFIDAVDLTSSDYWWDSSYSNTNGAGPYWTTSMHYKGTYTATGSYVYSFRNGTNNNRFGLYLNTDGSVWFVSADQSRSPNARWYFNNSGGDSIQDGAWHHILLMTDTTNTSNSKIYIDGVDQSITHTYTNSLDAWNWPLYDNVSLGDYYTSVGFIRPTVGEIAQVWGDSSYNSIDDFWDSDAGLALDLGSDGTGSGLSQPLIYFNGNTTSTPAFSDNGGSESLSFTEYGSPSDSSQGPEVV